MKYLKVLVRILKILPMYLIRILSMVFSQCWFRPPPLGRRHNCINKDTVIVANLFPQGAEASSLLECSSDQQLRRCKRLALKLQHAINSRSSSSSTLSFSEVESLDWARHDIFSVIRNTVVILKSQSSIATSMSLLQEHHHQYLMNNSRLIIFTTPSPHEGMATYSAHR